MKIKEILIVGIIVCLNNVFAKWHCRNGLTGGCLNAGTCDSDSGVCTCPEGFEGYNCGLNSGNKCGDDNTANCRNGGICFDTDKCFCTEDYIGDKCDTAVSSMTCRGEGTDVTVIVPRGFRGQIYSTQTGEATDDTAPDTCLFTAAAARPDGYVPYTFTIPFDGTSDCVNATLNITTNENGDSVYTTVIVKTYNPFFITDFDEQLTFVCVHSNNNFTLGTRLDQVDLDKSKDLQKDKKDEAYSPVRMNVLNKDDANLTGTVNVGDVIKLRFYLDDETVYKSLRMEDCVANDTRPDGKSFKFLEKGCPTDDGASIMVDTAGQTLTEIQHPFNGNTVSAAVLPMYAFKFKSAGNVAFNCQVKICKEGEDDQCQPKCGATNTDLVPAGGDTENAAETPSSTTAETPAETTADTPADQPTTPAEPPADTTGRRKRRSASGELKETFSAIVSVVDPFETQWRKDKVIISTVAPSPTTESPGEEKTCFRSQEILIVIIVMSVFVFILLVACLAMSCAILKLRNKFNSHHQENESHMPRFFLPHAKLQA